MDGCLRCCYIFLAVCLAGLIFCSYIHLKIIFNNEYNLISLNFMLVYQQKQSVVTPRLSESVDEYEGTRKKRFLYLVQSESCLPENLIADETLGNGDDRDVIVLNWQKRCTKHRKVLDHLTYIFDNRTSWGSGRNVLYRLARQRNRTYLYFIFLDEDIDIFFTPGIPRDFDSQAKSTAVGAFERFLVDYRPAVGLTHFCSRCGKLLSNGSYIASLCCLTRTVSSQLPLLLPVSITFDAAFNAFHRDIIDHLLPYQLRYENQSWWESQKYVILKADILFRGQVVRYNAITVLNNKHRQYPRRVLDNWMDILQEIRAETPSQYQNESVFRMEPFVDMVPEVRGRNIYTPRFNLTIPGPRTPFTPYSHFKINGNKN